MKIIHFSDTHLGFSAYRKISENGYNQREEDVLQAFSQSIDQIIEINPDLVLHAGDLFDVVRPTNRILRFAIEQILRLTEKEIPLVLISGNHETPKQRYMGSAFAIIDILPDPKKLRHIIYKNEYVKIPFEGITIHAIPQCTTDEIYKTELKKAKPDPKTKNILMLHTGVSGLDEFSHIESNELLVEKDWLDNSDFDYIALGHYHGYSKVGNKAWYSGSLERMSFNENGQRKGFIQLDISDNIKPAFIAAPTRAMEELSTIDAFNLDSVVLLENILHSIEQVQPADKILRLAIRNIAPHVLSSLDTKKIKEAAKDALHFEVRYEKTNEEGKSESLRLASGGVREEFKSFISQDTSLKDADKLTFTKLWQQKYDETIKEEE